MQLDTLIRNGTVIDGRAGSGTRPTSDWQGAGSPQSAA